MSSFPATHTVYSADQLENFKLTNGRVGFRTWMHSVRLKVSADSFEEQV